MDFFHHDPEVQLLQDEDMKFKLVAKASSMKVISTELSSEELDLKLDSSSTANGAQVIAYNHTPIIIIIDLTLFMTMNLVPFSVLFFIPFRCIDAVGRTNCFSSNSPSGLPFFSMNA